jgi:hypothetical protein
LNIQSNSDAQSLASSISSDYAAMESSIAFSIGIGLNRSLRSRLRALAGASESQPIFVRHMQTSAGIEIDPKGSVAARRQKPEGLPSIDLGQAVTREPALGDAVYAASAETRALRRTWKLMEPLVHGWGLPSRQQFGRLIEWSPVLEHLAYRCATRMSSLSLLEVVGVESEPHLCIEATAIKFAIRVAHRRRRRLLAVQVARRVHEVASHGHRIDVGRRPKLYTAQDSW